MADASDDESCEDASDFHDAADEANFSMSLMSQSSEDVCSETSAPSNETNLKDLLNDLGLMSYYNEKLSISTVREINKKTISDDPATSLSSLPWYFLKRLMMVNVTARGVKCSSPVDASLDSGKCSGLDRLLKYPDTKDQVNPLDLVTALFLCSDAFLQQEMALKMSMCQYSVPLLLPSCNINQPMLMLWALRDIVKSFKPYSRKDLSGFVEESIVLSNLPMVSFVRLGECSFSKSQILNKLLSNPQQYHDTFLHHDMDCGDTPRNISNGLVEISWYLPCGKRNIDAFLEPMAVANLRGDIRSFETQYSFLCQTSSAVFVFLDSLDTDYKILANQHHKAQLFLVCNAENKTFHVDHLERITSELDLKNTNIVLKSKKMNDAEFVRNLNSMLTNCLNGDPFKIQLEKMADIAHELGIHVDEDNQECQKAKVNALEITSKIEDTSDFKETALPLQGRIWKELAKLEKEECKLKKAVNQNIEHYKSDLKTQKKHLREKQCSHGMSEPMTCFINALSTSRLEKSYFLKWMTMNLDNLSRKSLTGLREKYKEKCIKNKEESQELDRRFSNTSLGIEHFIREMGQLYESAMTFPKKHDAAIKQMLQLPELCARLLMDGFPLELVDGDASNIPLKWVENVLLQLDRLVKPRNRILVVTVLGVQSTGKSTLLNTMFGVQFAVSSGRCTRGAFMLLIKVSDDLCDQMNCDYLVIIDTEGLKSPELAQLDDSYEHDNELATLVIGLSDVTIVNIAMENSTEMKDILQIVVHAFLRMKEVGKKPICHFVHQNVADVSAHDKNLRDRKLLLQQLDEMTQAAAKMEGKEDNQKFTDVMEYDPEKGNSYIPGLWHGNPPMASVNAGYSEAVNDLKKNMIQALGDCTTSGNIKDFLEWTKSLWNAVKYENFIFSFRNSLVADAYMRLCTEYNKWKWTFKKDMYKWLTCAEIKISNFDITRAESDISDYHLQLKAKALEILDQREKNILNNLTEYFKQTGGHVNLVEQYREEFCISVNCCRRELERSVFRELEQAVSIRQAMKILEKIKKNNTDLMEGKVRALVEKCKTSSSTKTDQELENDFENLWKETVPQLELTALEHINIETNVSHHLRENMKQKRSLVQEWINNSNLLECGKMPFTFTKESLAKKAYRKMSSLFTEDHTKDTKQMADSLIKKCETFIEEKCCDKGNYHENYIEEILHLIDDFIGNQKSNISEEFETSLKLHICGIAARKFQEMHRRFLKDNDPCRCVKQLKEQYFADFKDLYNERDQCKRKADEFANLCLRPAIETWVAASLGPDIVDEMLVGKNSLQFSTRAFFQYSLLKQLLDRCDFKNYMRYICTYEDFVKDWISGQILVHFASGNKMSQLEERYLKTISSEILEAIQSALEQTDPETTVKDFIQNICRLLGGKLAIPKDALDAVVALNNSKVVPFADSLSGIIQDIEKSIKDTFAHQYVQTRLSKLKMKPQDELFKRVFGCGMQCPFCNAPCEAGGDSHKEHFASIHKPGGLGTYRFKQSEKLVTDICSSAVHSEATFHCYKTSGQYYPFKKYREIFPDWHIPADPSIQASAYWKFVMTKFNKEFAKIWTAKQADIPPAWKTITKKQAEDSLKESFSMK